ncbi:putative F-box/LRR-repeat protein At1g56400 [Lotus japonicus]|uniref:putative F-box/LRR-repeat protein At1g56400 n=1 Tax=Lotus japonicus TaxID=34305 RepID=UPI0025833997|nr:putative F-box/LRR-repeat protein At1g56400 [Lotus japonicus]
MAPNTDRFSSLPQSLLSTIVSLIPFKEAVRTSILSKSWIDIFKSTSNIVFDEIYFVKSDQICEIQRAQRKAFLDFMMYWISNHTETVIDKFSLKLSIPENVKRVVRKCITFATTHRVKALNLDFCDPTLDSYFTTNYINHVALFELPAHVYGHTCLESLKLFSCNFVEAEFLNYNALKEISLGWMEVKLSTIKTLLSNCEALESLSLKRCWNSDEFDLGEVNLKLRKLVVDRCMFRSSSTYFIVNAPNLKYFYYSGLNNNFLVIDVRSLVLEEEVLEFCIEFKGHALFLYKLEEHISGVNVLTVGNYFLQGYESPDNLNMERFWTDHARAYSCMVYTLREVEIKGFKGLVNEIRALTYFITNGRVLRKMTINISKDDTRQESYHHDMAEWLISTVQKASTELEISIC